MRYRILIFIGLAIFSGWLMWHTLSYDSVGHNILVSGKFWSDFGGYLPQIRSFSLGKNWPPQYPLYPGEPTRYHFLFFMIAGLLEKVGIRIDIALNLISAIGFFLLLIMIWIVSYEIFSDERVSWLSLLFFLFNGSFSFLDFLKKYPLSPQSLNNLIHLRDFPSFAPWNGSQIAAFWNLNIYTNQRHLGLSFALCLLLIYLLISHHKKGLYWVGFITGLFLVLNQAVFVIAVLFVGWFFLSDKSIRIPLLISALGGLPWIYSVFLATPTKPPLNIHLGFLTQPPTTLINILYFWLLNIGLHLFLIPVGLFLAPKQAKAFIVPLLVLFLIPNVFQLSVDIINNHKLFNFFLIIGVMFSAYAIIRIWDAALIGKITVPIIIFFLILGGLVDLFPVINDTFYAIPDVKANPDAAYIVSHTPPDAVVLNSTWFYHPASIAGRYIYNGYPYFTWSFGYDQITREQITKNIYSAPTKTIACNLLHAANISYVELNPHPEGFLKPNWSLWQTDFIPAYTNPKSSLHIYSVSQNCLVP
jgi:hypothetical protein